MKDNLYLITGGGGNTAAFVTDGGVAVVDIKNAGWGDAILDKIKTVTDKLGRRPRSLAPFQRPGVS